MDTYGDNAFPNLFASTPSSSTYVIDNTDCDDANANIFPGSPEICDGIDNDCNGIIDDGFTLDIDNDNILDCVDNCLIFFNPTQTDTDGDGIGDDCDCNPNDPNPIVTINNNPIATGIYLSLIHI